MAAERPWLRVVHHPQNRGYGQALISGFSVARHDWIFYTDGDAQYDAREAAVLVPLATCCGRHRPGLQGRAWRPVVPQGDRAGRTTTSSSSCSASSVRDTDCDFRLFRRRLFTDARSRRRAG